MITDSPAAEAYPISCFTWIILYKEQAYADRSESQARATVELLDWMPGSTAQELTTRVHYSPLPAPAANQAKKLLRTVVYQGKPILN